MMTRLADLVCMRFLLPLLACAVATHAEPARVPGNVAAMHPEGEWQVRKSDLYRYLVRYYSGQPKARAVLPEYLKRRLVEDEAQRRSLGASQAEVQAWLDALDRRVRAKGGTLDDLRKEMGMTKRELARRGKQWILQEKVARAIYNEADRTRRKDQPVSEDSVILAIDELYRKAPKSVDPAELPRGVVARVRGIDIKEYEYGRALSFELPATEVLRALQDLILVQEVNLLLGSDDPPSDEDLRAQKEWFYRSYKNRLKGQVKNPELITDETVDQLHARRGLTMDKVFDNPAFLAQARARGHFERKQTDETLETYYEKHRGRYGDRLRVARILVAARAQRVVAVQKKIRSLEQGKALAEALWIRATQGEDFDELAKKNSDDPDTIRLNGGMVPFLVTADRPDYADTYQHAVNLKEGEVSKPFFSQGRGYVIVKLLERHKAAGFDGLKPQIRRDAAEQEYQIWRRTQIRAALKSDSLLDR